MRSSFLSRSLGYARQRIECMDVSIDWALVQVHGVGRTVRSYSRIEYGRTAYGRFEHRESLCRPHGQTVGHLLG